MKKKIAVIGLKGLPAFGGAAAVGENIIAQLKDTYNFTVYSISSHTEQRSGKYNGYSQIVFRKFPIKKWNIYYYYFLSVLHCIFFSRYDLIHVHHTSVAIIIPLLNFKYKTIITSHASMQKIKVKKFKYDSIDTFFLLISEKFLKFANVITAVSRNLSIMLSTSYSVDVKYIPNGVIPLDNNLISDRNVDKNEEYILFAAGRIIHTKECHILIQALNQLEYTGKVIIAGDMSQNTKYSQYLFRISKKLNISFLGMIKNKNDLFSIIKNSKLFIYPSSSEAMSMMLLEVASCKIPIICSDIEENKEIFGENVVQYFETNNYIDLANKIKWAFKNYNIFQSMGNKAYDKIIIKFNWADIARQYADLYNKLLKTY